MVQHFLHATKIQGPDKVPVAYCFCLKCWRPYKWAIYISGCLFHFSPSKKLCFVFLVDDDKDDDSDECE